jgi:hypothetical protein
MWRVRSAWRFSAVCRLRAPIAAATWAQVAPPSRASSINASSLRSSLAARLRAAASLLGLSPGPGAAAPRLEPPGWPGPESATGQPCTRSGMSAAHSCAGPARALNQPARSEHLAAHAITARR